MSGAANAMFSPRGSTACDVGHKIGPVVAPWRQGLPPGAARANPLATTIGIRSQSGTGRRQIWANTRQTVWPIKGLAFDGKQELHPAGATLM